MKLLLKILFSLQALVFVLGAPLAARAQIEPAGKDNLRLAHETEEQLLSLGCEKVLISNTQALLSAQSLGWYAVIPVDAAGESVAMCSPNIVQQLKPLQEGKVFGYEKMGGGEFFESGPKTGKTVGEYSLQGLQGFAKMISIQGKIVLDALTAIVGPALTTGNITGNAAVVKAWPVVLGLANLGFLLALITIALLVTLRSSAGGGARRLLPRLLLGAVLINFSLLICGLIIDMSRVFMILSASILDLGNLDEALFARMYESADVHQIGPAIAERTEASPLMGQTIAAFIEAILMWIMVIGVAVVAFTLVVRYYALIVLAIISPFAYLAFAFPGAQKAAATWWSHFMRYVIFGPILLIILLVAIEATTELPRDLFSQSGNGELAFWLLKVAMYVGGLFFAAVAGRYAGVAGSAMILNTVSRTGKKVRSMAYRGGVRATAPVRPAAGDFARGTKEGSRSRIPKVIRPVRRDKDGVPLKGQPKPYAKSLGAAALGGSRDRKQRKEAKAARRFIPAGRTPAELAQSVAGSTAWAPTKLKQPHVGGSLAEEQRQNIMGMGSKAQKVALAGNKEAVRKMSDQEKDVILNLAVNLPTNSGISAKDSANQMLNSINRDIQKAFQASLNQLDKDKG